MSTTVARYQAGDQLRGCQSRFAILGWRAMLQKQKSIGVLDRLDGLNIGLVGDIQIRSGLSPEALRECLTIVIEVFGRDAAMIWFRNIYHRNQLNFLVPGLNGVPEFSVTEKTLVFNLEGEVHLCTDSKAISMCQELAELIFGFTEEEAVCMNTQVLQIGREIFGLEFEDFAKQPIQRVAA